MRFVGSNLTCTVLCQWVMHASANMFKAQPAELLDGRSGDKRPPAPRDPSWRHQAAVNKHVRRQQAAQLREASLEEELQVRRHTSHCALYFFVLSSKIVLSSHMDCRG